MINIELSAVVECSPEQGFAGSESPRLVAFDPHRILVLAAKEVGPVRVRPELQPARHLGKRHPVVVRS